ncbi:MAG: bifunctional UDP-N-acetylmuramoyl-tripeptide:D-alanyl-D-alanine ligase/alanine racemase [Tannerellaceae bacterium]|jgi:alanine racemase|nr:bifunctional UDP-N-acetylmuramoyl-tripeptide:D-alanyl-D-alanine ligase/alanine racemase [Tannerellaceae bacterium]
MEYTINEVAGIIGSTIPPVHETRIGILLTDSRRVSSPEASLFFALKTRTNDGHKYLDELYRLGVRNFVVCDLPPNMPEMPGANFLKVKDTLKALQKLAVHHRRRFEIPVVGIAGSNGKTIVKEFLYQLLRKEFHIVRSPRSFNSQLGVPLSVWEMNPQHTLGIFEAGISKPDEMEVLEPIIAPTIGVFTGIGEAHQENFVSMYRKCMEKLMLFAHSEAVVYNADNAFVGNCIEASLLAHRAVGWSRVNSEAPLFIEEVRKTDTETHLACRIMGMRQTYTIPFTDEASIENVIHCLGVMLYLKPTVVRDRTRFERLEAVEMRLEVLQGVRNCLLINDAYNSDIHSLGIALDFMQSRRAGKDLTSTLILSDILQSGFLPKSLYKKVADLVRRRKVQRLIGIGRDITEHGALFDIPRKEFYRTTADFLNSPSLRTLENEIVLLKGSRRFRFEEIAERLEKKVHETILEVNLDAVAHNFNSYRALLRPETKIIAMLKAFGYGVGSGELAKTLQEYRCDYLAVALTDEGVELRREGISIPILVMNPEMSNFHHLEENLLEPEVYSFRLLEAMIRETQRRGIIAYPVHIKIDTGMHRLGFRPSDVPQIAALVRKQTGISVRSVFSHLVASDSPAFDAFTRGQIETFRQAARSLEDELGYPLARHILNSAGIERFPEEQMEMVRLGIGLYGVSVNGNKELQNVATLRSLILQIQDVPAGDSVGYSRQSYATENSRIAVIPIGYADGLNRQLGNGVGAVWIKNRLCPIIGNICMDTTLVDVTATDACEGDAVIVFGEAYPITRLAHKLNTIPYEILTSISPRVKRIYYKE